MNTPSKYHKHTPPTRRFMTLVYYTGGRHPDPRVKEEPLVKHKREQPRDVVESYNGRQRYQVQDDGSLRRCTPKRHWRKR